MKGSGEYHENLAKETEYKILDNIGVRGASWTELLKRTGLSKSTLSKTLRRLINRGVLEKRSPPFGEKKELGDFVEEGSAWEVRDWFKSPKRRKAILRSYGHFQPKHIRRKGESPREFLRRVRKETKPRYMFKHNLILRKKKEGNQR